MTRHSNLHHFLVCLLFFCCLLSVQRTSAASVAFHSPEDSPVMIPALPAMPPPLPDTEFPLPDLKSAAHKLQLQKIEELGKLHRFHKERVKKVNKHQNEYWLAALLIIVSCHLALLVHAFMHLPH